MCDTCSRVYLYCSLACITVRKEKMQVVFLLLPHPDQSEGSLRLGASPMSRDDPAEGFRPHLFAVRHRMLFVFISTRNHRRVKNNRRLSLGRRSHRTASDAASQHTTSQRQRDGASTNSGSLPVTALSALFHWTLDCLRNCWRHHKTTASITIHAHVVWIATVTQSQHPHTAPHWARLS